VSVRERVARLEESLGLGKRRRAPAVERKDRRYRGDAWSWACEQVRTIDEATQQVLPWPDKTYLRELFHALDTEPLLAIPKSRRMMGSWGVSAWAVHRARYFENNAIFVQSETEDKAAYLLDKRAAFIEDHIASEYRRAFASHRTIKGAIGRITYAETGSYLWAIAQGDSVIRAYTFSVLISDEMDFQPEGHKAFVAALPTAEKNARLILLSSSNGPGGVIAGLCREVGFVRFA
jgi:hypothetical protein